MGDILESTEEIPSGELPRSVREALDIEMDTAKKWQNFSLGCIGLVFLVGLIFYLKPDLYLLKGSNDITKIGAFGDYWGGILNPGLSLVAALLFFVSLMMQRIEFKENREQFKAERKAHIYELRKTKENQEGILKESQRKASTDEFNNLIQEFFTTYYSVRVEIDTAFELYNKLQHIEKSSIDKASIHVINTRTKSKEALDDFGHEIKRIYYYLDTICLELTASYLAKANPLPIHDAINIFFSNFDREFFDYLFKFKEILQLTGRMKFVKTYQFDGLHKSKFLDNRLNLESQMEQLEDARRYAMEASGEDEMTRINKFLKEENNDDDS